MSQKHRLYVDEINTIGFVGKGDNPPAEIVFFKRKETPVKKPSTLAALLKLIGVKAGVEEAEVEKLLAETQGGDEDMPFDITKMTPEQQAAFATAVQAEVAKQKPTDVSKTLDELKEAITKANARAEAAETQVKAMQDASEKARYAKRVAALGLPGMTADDFGSIFRKIDGALSKEESEKLEEVLRGAGAQVRESLLIEVGSANAATPDEVTQLVKAYREKDPKLSEQEARAKVWLARPDLYQKYRDTKDRALKTVMED